MLCWAVDFNLNFQKELFWRNAMRFSLSKKSWLSKAWAVLDSCKNNSYILPRDNDPAHVLLIPHTPLPLAAGSSPSRSQIDILGELRDTHHPKNCLSFLFSI